METQQVPKKLTPNEVILNLVRHLNADRRDQFYREVEQYADTMAHGSQIRFTLKNHLRQKPMKLTLLDGLNKNLKSLISVTSSEQGHVYLPLYVKTLVDVLLKEWANAEVYAYHNLPVRRKILLHGPTGNGKTTIARHIAKLADLPFVEVSADSMIDSSLGRTGTNIKAVFSQLQEPAVLFWDEVDTIGRKRSSKNDDSAGVENDRMVNSMLVNMEKMHPDVILIGATNRREILDSAFVRRFDVELELAPPDDNQKAVYLTQLADYYKLPKAYLGHVDMSAESYANLKAQVVGLARNYVSTLL